MSEVSPTELRIFCICGQKMKVTSSMFGKPGKCVACRQKIRIPSEHELPGDGTAIHLKDHPEFLRKPKPAPAPAVETPEDPIPDLENEIVLLAVDEDHDELSTVPFVVYEPIVELCNYEHALNEQLEALRKGKKASHDKATLMSYKGLARKSRLHLEKRIRDELIEIATALDANREASSRALVSLRTGERAYLPYSKTVLPLRKEREVLIVRQHNLRGWLATDNPHTAGGLREVSLSDVPLGASAEPFPLETEIDCLPIENAVLKLEGALRARERADKRLNETHHMHLKGTIDAAELAETRLGIEAERERARSGVAYFRSRLEQVIQDCEDDSDALKAYQDVKKDQLDNGALSKEAYKGIEEAIFRAQVDIKRARNMANRALNANAVSDVPNPRGTFLERLARPGSYRGIGVDSWMAWLGSALMLAVIFVPITENAPGGNAALFQVFTLGLFVGAAALGLSATILLRVPRALVLCLLWLVITVSGAAYFEYELNSEGMAGAALRTGGPWWSTLGGLLLLAGWAVAALSTVVSSFPVRAIRWVGPLTIVLGASLAGFIVTGYGGQLRPVPYIEIAAPEPNAETGQYTMAIALRNDGKRPFWVGGDGAGVPAAAAYRMEQQQENGDWQQAEQLAMLTLDSSPAAADSRRGLRVPSGATATLRYRLQPGAYRFRFTPSWPGERPREYTFDLESFEVDLGRFFTPPVSSPVDNETAKTPPTGESATVELKGVVDGQDSQPNFSIVLTLPDGTQTREQYRIGDTLWGEWKITEFNPAHTTITLSNGDRLLIVARSTPEKIR